MRPLMMIGLILVLLGVLALGYQGVAYVTTRDTVVKAGPVETQEAGCLAADFFRAQ